MVSVGATWSEESNEHRMNVKTIYTVSKIENGKVYADVKGSLSGKGGGAFKRDIVIEIESGIQHAVNVVISLNANGTDMKIITKRIVTKM